VAPSRDVTIRHVNIRDERTIGEQIKSGFRLGGWVLLTLAFILVVLGSTTFFVGKGDHTQPIHRILGACGLVSTSGVMFVTVRHWVKWFIGALGYFALKTAIALVLGFTPSVPSVARPRLVFLELLVLLVLAVVLCARYLNHAPRKIEGVGLVGLVIALSFSIVFDSNLPLLSGVAMLGLIQLAHGAKRLRLKRLPVEGRPL
jgi:hypothetical protein